MKISNNGVDFIASWESFSATAYKGAGETYWTIGYGHYGSDVKEGDTITKEEAWNLLLEDCEGSVASTNSIALSKFPNLNQNQFDALVSYCFNRGAGASDGHNGLRQLIVNSNTLDEVYDNFLVYWGTNTAVYEGLINRRKGEQKLWKGEWGNPSEEQPDDDSNQKIIDSAVKWACDIANDDSHGYDQENRDGPDYDCSSLIIHAYKQAGLDTGATWTGDMKSCFIKHGFIAYDFSDVKNALIKGDVLLKEKHTEMYIGNDKKVGAHINELGTITGGQTGDQTGHEIDIDDYDSTAAWVTVLRLPTNSTPDTPEEPEEPTENSIYDLLLKTVFNIKTLNNEEIAFLKSIKLGDSVKMKFTFNHNKRQVGTTANGKRLTFDTKTYKIDSINKKGFLILTFNNNIACHKKINPKYIKGVSA